MDTTTGRGQRVADVARTVGRVAVRLVVALVLVRLLLALLGLVGPGALDRSWAWTCAGLLSLACLAQASRLVALFADELRRPHGRDLPLLGRWARLACRGSATMTASLVVCGVAVVILQVVSEQLSGHSQVLEQALGVALVGAFFAAMGALVSGAVWAIAEVGAGFREPALGDRARPT